jgi:uncharacterized protein (TIGR00266 family)
MRAEITGTVLPVLEVRLDPGDIVVSAPGELAWMTANIRMNTTTATAGASGLWGALTRAVSGGGLFMTEYAATGGAGGVAFAPKIPGHIVPVEVRPGRGYLIHRDGFLCATQGVQLTTALQRSLGAGIFGGEGFILQHLAGDCQAWVALGGEIVSNELQAGETLLVHPGHVGMFEDGVTFEITTISGVRNALFGGDGIFLVQLTGPGRIWLQTMTVPNLAHAVVPYLPRGASGVGTTQAAEFGVAGAVLKGILGNNR